MRKAIRRRATRFIYVSRSREKTSDPRNGRAIERKVRRRHIRTIKR